MLKKWRCKYCRMEILAFVEDIAKDNKESWHIIKDSKKYCVPFGYVGQQIIPEQHYFIEVPDHNQSTLHGEAGFGVEGTVLDSTDTIHEYEKVCNEKAAEERELHHFLEGRKMV